MEREYDLSADVIDLGAVSVETRGIAPLNDDVVGIGSPVGITED